ncbi:MAG: hypothetical protein ACOC9U_02850 [bacterium]|jgi:hypothetical protein
MRPLLILAAMALSALTCELRGAGTCRWVFPAPASRARDESIPPTPLNTRHDPA